MSQVVGKKLRVSKTAGEHLKICDIE